MAKYLTPEVWEKLKNVETKTSGFTLARAVACAVQFEDQNCGIYAGDEDSYEDFRDIFEPILLDYHALPPDFNHTTDLDVGKIIGNISPDAPVHSTR